MHTCVKVAYRTMEEATLRAVAWRLVEQYPMRVYACPRCGAYHLATAKKTSATAHFWWLRREADYWLHRLRGSRGRWVL